MGSPIVWTNLSLQNNWKEYGTNPPGTTYYFPQWSFAPGCNKIITRGLLKKTGTPTIGEVIAVIPVSAPNNKFELIPVITNLSFTGQAQIQVAPVNDKIELRYISGNTEYFGIKTEIYID